MSYYIYTRVLWEIILFRVVVDDWHMDKHFIASRHKINLVIFSRIQRKYLFSISIWIQLVNEFLENIKFNF